MVCLATPEASDALTPRPDFNFTPATTSPEPTGPRPRSVAVGDFNSDGKRDLAVANFGFANGSSANSVTILMGAGTGDFTAPSSSPESVGGAPRSVAVGDFNNDGKQDLATANTASNNVSVLLGDGTGNFTATATSPGTGSSPNSIAVGDFNGDGKQDLATANPATASNNVTVLLGAGDGTFSASNVSAGPRPMGLAVGDFNGDLKQDLAVTNINDHQLTILIGSGTGTFTGASGSPVGVGRDPVAVVTGDFNSDGKQDLATANNVSNDVSVLIGAGNGTFSLASAVGVNQYPEGLAASDFNGDGRQDLVTANLAGNLTILAGAGNGTFSIPATSPEGVGNSAYSVAVGDFNGDDRPDLAASTESGNVAVLIADNLPSAVNDSQGVLEDSGATTIDVLANDNDSDGGPKSIASTTNASHGTVAITNSGANLTYAPNANYCGPDSFSYSLSPGGSTATVSVTITCVDDSPVAVDDSATVTEDDPATSINVFANDTDSDGGPKSIASVDTTATNGQVTIDADNLGLKYKPNANYCNDPGATPADSFNYSLSPGGSTATVSVTVTCVDDSPVADNDSKTLTEDDPATTIDVLANDDDSDGGPKAIASTTNASHGTVAITNSGADLTYASNANYCGPDSFSYSLSPGGSTATVSVTVTCVDDSPVADNDSKTLTEDDPATTIDVLANDDDSDGGPKSIASTTNASHGTVAITNSGADLTYAPNANYCGPDSFSYSLSPGGSTATVSVTITCVNDAPSGADSSNTINEDTTKAFTTADFGLTDANDSPPGSLAGLILTTLPASGTLELDGTPAAASDTATAAQINAGKLTYTPVADACRSPYASFNFRVIDDGGTANGGTDTDPTPNTISMTSPACPTTQPPSPIPRPSARTIRRPQSTCSPTTPTPTAARRRSSQPPIPLMARSRSRIRVPTSPTHPTPTTAAPIPSATPSTEAPRQRSTSRSPASGRLPVALRPAARTRSPKETR